MGNKEVISMKRLFLLLSITACLEITACEPAIKVSLTQQFRSDEVEFIR